MWYIYFIRKKLYKMSTEKSKIKDKKKEKIKAKAILLKEVVEIV